MVSGRMNHNYFKSGYHPGQVSFEVTAMLIEEEKCRAKGASFMRDTLICSNYEWGGYSREIERAFNPLTDQRATFKYTQYKRKHKIVHDYLDKLKKEEKVLKKQIGLAIFYIHKVKEVFNVVIQNMLIKHILLHNSAKVAEVSHVNFLNITQVNKLSAEHVIVEAKYIVHPHVDALLRERAQQNHGCYR
jgi:hypothetical protein